MFCYVYPIGCILWFEKNFISFNTSKINIKYKCIVLKGFKIMRSNVKLQNLIPNFH